ncbi:MAG: DUF5719 family protein [Candidatus Geothermincolia bacterium]
MRHPRTTTLVSLTFCILLAIGACALALPQKAQAQAALITGKVTAGSTPLSHIMVVPFDATGMATTETPPYTGADGSYGLSEADGVTSGQQYSIFFFDEAGTYGCQWYTIAPTYAGASPVLAPHANINVSLGAAVTLQGHVREDGSGLPLANSIVDVYDSSDWVYLTTVTTDANGAFNVKGLHASTNYRLYAFPPDGSIYMARWYGNAGTWATAKNVMSGSTNADVYLWPKQKPRLDSVDPGTGSAGTEVVVAGEWFGNSTGAATVTFGGAAATDFVSWSNTEIRLKAPSAPLGAGEVVVTTVRGDSEALPFTVAAPAWYLAEGTSDWGFDTYITIENPNASNLTAKVTYMTKSGPKVKDNVPLPALSQTVINPRNDLGATDFSTKVECKQAGKWITVDRRMIWAGPGAPSTEGHASVGVTNPSTIWYLAEGSSKWGFETWLLIQNPGSAEANVAITYMPDSGEAKTITKSVPAESRRSFNLKDDMGEVDASIKVEASTPVIAERAMYRYNRREGHDSIGTTTPATDFYLAEGTTGYGFTTYILVQNPNDAEAEVTLTYMTKTGAVAAAPFKMAAKTRKTVCVNDTQKDVDLSTHVSGTLPIIAERAMYWGAGTPLGEACHGSIGLNAPHMGFYLPDGETANGYETWTLVQNPNASDVKIEVSYLTPTGTGNKVLVDTVKANSRKTYFMADSIPSGRASIVVKSKTSGMPVMVERAMYWNSRGAGTDTIGGFTDW